MLLEEATKLFKTLGDSNRVRIVNLLMEREMCATEILEQLEISQPTLSHHMKLLTDADLVKSRREHTMTFYRLNNVYVNDVCRYISAMAPVEPEADDDYPKKSQCVAEQLEFLMQVSHRLRTEINGIKGMLLMIDKAGGDQNLIGQYVGKITEATGNLEDMVDEIVDKSELELDTDILLFESFNVYDTARELNTMYAPLAEKAGILYKSVAGGEIKHPNIICSRLYVKKLWQVILGSVIQNGCRGGELTITFEELGASQNVTNHRITIETRNMPLDLGEEREMIETMVQKLRGTVGFGDKLTIDLPLQIDKRTETVLMKKASAGINGARILLVEDNELNMEVAEFILKDAGAVPVLAHNGKDAVDIVYGAAEGEFDLVLMDIEMPVMDGYEAAKAIRAMNRTDTKSIPIIAMSANAFVKDIMMALEAGMDEHVAKPLDHVKLMTVLRKWLA